ncbi:MAG: hypothetical protein RLZZ52_746 [Actinomycetota bacterium]|jgi:mRNA interferase RelE/StbE
MSKWELRFTQRFTKSASKLDHYVQRTLTADLEFIAQLDDPKSRGTALVGNLAGYWRYRSGDYRIFVKFLNNELVILAVDVGHRSRIYRQ